MKSRIHPTRSYKAAKAALRGKPTRKQERGARAKAQREIAALLRESVIARATRTVRLPSGATLFAAVCENPDCNEPNALGGSVDHWLGGAGRRLPKQSTATCWWLCSDCHALRTRNEPSAKVWNDRFEMHARRYGYPVVRHLEREPVRR